MPTVPKAYDADKRTFRDVCVTIQVHESGMPRGERRWWHVSINGVVIYESANKANVMRVYDQLQLGLNPY